MIKTINELNQDLQELKEKQQFLENRLLNYWIFNNEKTEIENEFNDLNLEIQKINHLLENSKMKNQENLDLQDLRKCINCNNDFDLEDLEKIEGDYYCEDCKIELFIYCDFCNELHDSDSSVYFEDDYYCESCADNNLFSCAECGELEKNNNAHNLYNGDSICDSCYCDSYFSCYECGEVFHIDNSYYSERNGDYYCENCYCEENEIREFSNSKMNFENNTFEIIKSKRCFGIELELANNEIDYDSIEDNTIFGSKEDCSLNCGSEFYSPILQGDTGIKEVEKLYKIIEGAENDNSAGLHIHIDMRKDLDDFNFIKKLIFIYNRIEKIIYSIIGANRLSNRYCKPLRVNENKILDLQNFEDLRRFRSNDLRHDRYFGFNLEALDSHDTIELRYREGITKFNHVFNWIKLNLYIFDFCKNNSLQKIINITNNLNSLDRFITFLGIISIKDYNLIGFFISEFNKKEAQEKINNEFYNNSLSAIR